MKKSFLVLALLTILVVIAAWVSVVQRSPETKVEKSRLFPELASKINEVSGVEITDNKESLILSGKEGKWGLDNHGGYPIDVNRIKPLVLGISELEIREAKTANPKLFSRLEVENVSEKNARSRQITLWDVNGGVIASFILGKDRVNRTDGVVDSFYVRRSGEEQSYLVKGQVDVSASAKDWWNNELIDLSSDRLKHFLIKYSGAADQTVRASRKVADDENYELEDIPEGFKVQSQTAIDSLARVVEEMSFDNVESSADFMWPEEFTVSEYTTFDGMTIKIKSAKIKNDIWSEFSFDYAANETGENLNNKSLVKEEVRLLNAKVDGWVYALPSFKTKMLLRKLQELIIAVEPEEVKDKSSNDEQHDINNSGGLMPAPSSFKEALPMKNGFPGRIE